MTAELRILEKWRLWVARASNADYWSKSWYFLKRRSAGGTPASRSSLKSSWDTSGASTALEEQRQLRDRFSLYDIPDFVSVIIWDSTIREPICPFGYKGLTSGRVVPGQGWPTVDSPMRKCEHLPAGITEMPAFLPARYYVNNLVPSAICLAKGEESRTFARAAGLACARRRLIAEAAETLPRGPQIHSNFLQRRVTVSPPGRAAGKVRIGQCSPGEWPRGPGCKAQAGHVASNLRKILGTIMVPLILWSGLRTNQKEELERTSEGRTGVLQTEHQACWWGLALQEPASSTSRVCRVRPGTLEPQSPWLAIPFRGGSASAGGAGHEVRGPGPGSQPLILAAPPSRAPSPCGWGGSPAPSQGLLLCRLRTESSLWLLCFETHDTGSAFSKDESAGLNGGCFLRSCHN